MNAGPVPSLPPVPVPDRHIGLFGAVTIGVGAIVGGGILVLAGTALAATGPSSILAFLLNGILALVTALSFAEMASSIPENGGAYTFARKVLSIRAAFGVGWIVWLAYIVAAALYALGFAAFALAAVDQLLATLNVAVPTWLERRGATTGLATLASLAYTSALLRKVGGGGQWETWGKVVLFCGLIAVGLWVTATRESASVAHAYTPFFPEGLSGLFGAMGVTFIALQGFDLISAVGGEVKDPQRIIPRAMLVSLAIALGVYLPLLFVVTCVGVPEGSTTTIQQLSAADPDTAIALAARNYMGQGGYWVVVSAAILSTLSALQANLMAASRVARSMALDRTLPSALASTHRKFGTPFIAVFATELALVAVLLMSSDVASAGAGASLIFLVTFALVQWIAVVARRRSEDAQGFRAPWFPILPIVGGGCCALLAIYQAVAVPQAGAITLIWLGLGALLYFALFSERAKAMDATLEALDPQLLQLRGRAPLVLVPVANPESASAMIEVGQALAHSKVGKVLLLNVISRHQDVEFSGLRQGQEVLREALVKSFSGGRMPEALMSIAEDPWPEIIRIAREHRCENLVLGLGPQMQTRGGHLEILVNAVECDVTLLRAPIDFSLAKARRLLVPVSGGGLHHAQRARLLGSLARQARRDVVFVGVVPQAAAERKERAVHSQLEALAEDEVKGNATTRIRRSDDVVDELVREASEADLLILGIRQQSDGRKVFSGPILEVIERTSCPVIVVSSN